MHVEGYVCKNLYISVRIFKICIGYSEDMDIALPVIAVTMKWCCIVQPCAHTHCAQTHTDLKEGCLVLSSVLPRSVHSKPRSSTFPWKADCTVTKTTL